MALVQALECVTLRTPSVERSARFYQDVMRLTPVSASEGRVGLAGAAGMPAWVLLEASDEPGVRRISYLAASAAALTELADRLRASGTDYWPGVSPAGEASIRFREPNGVELELSYRAEVTGAGATGDAHLERALHAVWYVSDIVATEQFFEDVLGFLPSDWIEQTAVFMRAGNSYHHSLGLLANPERSGELDHLCLLADDLDDLMRMRHNAHARDIEFRQDLARHEASGSISTYFIDPVTGLVNEVCVWHGKITDTDYRPRVLPRSPATANIWTKPFAAAAPGS